METLSPEVIHRDRLVRVLLDNYTEVLQGKASPEGYLPEMISLQVSLLDNLCWELLGVSLIGLAEEHGVGWDEHG